MISQSTELRIQREETGPVLTLEVSDGHRQDPERTSMRLEVVGDIPR